MKLFKFSKKAATKIQTFKYKSPEDEVNVGMKFGLVGFALCPDERYLDCMIAIYKINIGLHQPLRQLRQACPFIWGLYDLDIYHLNPFTVRADPETYKDFFMQRAKKAFQKASIFPNQITYRI